MSNLPIGRFGKILAGDERGRLVKILDDSGSTGGFLILTADDPEFRRRGYDNWAQDEAALKGYFKESGWLIEWMS